MRRAVLRRVRAARSPTMPARLSRRTLLSRGSRSAAYPTPSFAIAGLEIYVSCFGDRVCITRGAYSRMVKRTRTFTYLMHTVRIVESFMLNEPHSCGSQIYMCIHIYNLYIHVYPRPYSGRVHVTEAFLK